MAPRGAPDYLILKRRKAEEDRRAYEGYTRSNFKAETNAEWEIRTQGVIENTQTKQRYESIRRADQQALDIRRRKLAEMLGAEQAMFQYQLESLAEAPEQRKARMESRAKELKDKREQERLEFVRQQYERQWRLACDPLRELESKAILRATNAARAYQIGEKMKALEMEEEVCFCVTSPPSCLNSYIRAVPWSSYIRTVPCGRRIVLSTSCGRETDRRS